MMMTRLFTKVNSPVALGLRIVQSVKTGNYHHCAVLIPIYLGLAQHVLFSHTAQLVVIQVDTSFLAI